MSLQTLSALLAAILTFVIGWSVALRDRRQRQYVTFAVLCFNLGFWYLAHFLSTTWHSGGMQWVDYFFAISIPLSVERFFRAFLADDPRYPRPLSRSVLVFTIAFYLALFVGLFYPIHTSRLFSAPLLVFIFASLAHCVYLIHARKRASGSRPEAIRLTYLLYGGAATILLAAADFLPTAGVTFPTLGNVLTVVYLYFISQTLFRHRLLDIKELLGKMATLATLVLILTTVYGLLLVWVGRDQPGVFFFNTVIASFVILVLFDQLRSRVEDRISRWLFAEKYAFSRRLRLLNQELANIIEVRMASARIIHELEESARITHCSVYLSDPAGAHIRLIGHSGQEPIRQLDRLTRRLFLERLRQHGWLTVETLEAELAGQTRDALEDAAVATRNVLATMEELHADLCIALVTEEELVGLLNLRDDRLREAYASEEIEQLRRVAAQAAITIRNSKLYEQMKERDRLAALGQMAAGLAHEIRNPLGAIKGAAQLLSGESPAGSVDDQEYLGIIVEEVDRLDNVVSQFLGYARPDRGQRQPLKINDIVRKTAQILRSQHDGGPEIVVDLAPGLPPVYGDAEQLRQVFLNLALNGLQAMEHESSAQLRIETRLRRGFRGSELAELVEVAFHDTGAGIPADVLSDIFIPFFTTKARGTGLGLPICQRIVENHRGSIEVRSDPGKESVFSVLLPKSSDTDITQNLGTRSGLERDATSLLGANAGAG